MTAKHPSIRTLPDSPDLDQLKRQAKELVHAFAEGDAGALALVNAHYRGARPESFALHQAQLVLARSYGFQSWPRLKAYVDGITVHRLADAVRAGDLAAVRSMVEARPELVNLCMAENDEHRALHHAVLEGRPEMVRLLMQHGANPHEGIWPHRVATSPLTLATERGLTEIVAIIRAEERRRGAVPFAAMAAHERADLSAALERGDEDAMIAALEAHPALIQAANKQGWTALHWAAARLWPQLSAWLLEHGADVKARTHAGETAMDVVGQERDPASGDAPRLATKLAEMLLGRGSDRTARWAVVTGDTNWLRDRHAEGGLSNQRGLLHHAVRSNRPEVLRVLLDLGFDPDESGKVEGLDEVVLTWGQPLRECASSGRLAMAQLLLERGANPNTNVYASSCALSQAYGRRDAAMIALLEKHGARLSAGAVGEFGLTDQAARLLADDAAGRTPEKDARPGASAAAELLWGAIGSGSPEIVRMALDHIDWPRDDARWHGILENGLYLGPTSNRPAHLEAFRLALNASDPNVLSKRGATLLHDVVASRGGLTSSDRLTYAQLLLEAGARLDVRDDLLRSTPLGWACRWGRTELVPLFLANGADPVEPDAEPWATPMAWAEKMNHGDVVVLLRKHSV
jgi:ankyrin repeat protein